MTRSVDEGIAVVVPSYGRPATLRRCLNQLVTEPETVGIVAVVRDGDVATGRVVEEFAPRVRSVTVNEPGVLAAMSAGAATIEAPLVAFTDDDAVPMPGWPLRLADLLSDPEVGVAGGRDLLTHETPAVDGGCSVGRVSWFGRVTGNHHAGEGAVRDVDFLKGVNFAIRRGLLELDSELIGEGAQPHWELDLCLRSRSLGYRVVYDPSVQVVHDIAPRVDEAQRAELPLRSIYEATHNQLYVLLKWLRGPRRVAVTAYAFLVGTRLAPGVLLALEQLVRGGERRTVLRRWRATFSGDSRALASYRRHAAGRP